MSTETVTPETPPPVDPAVAAAAAAASAVVDPPAAIDPPAVETPPAPVAVDPPAEPTERQHGNKGRKPWYLDRISEESEARRQAEERARNAEELLQRSQTRADPVTTPPRSDDTAVETRARQMAEQIAQETINTNSVRSVVSAGIGKFADWDERMGVLAGAIGVANTSSFALDVHSVDPANAHEILHQLADDPQKAAHLAKMDTRTRTIELVKMSMAASKAAPAAAEPKPAPAPKTVSKAPAPPPAVEPGASQTIDWRSDKASDDDFSKGWEARQRERAANRR